MEDTIVEGFAAENLISVGNGEYMRHKSGEKKGQYITLAEFTALSKKRQAVLLTSYDAERNRKVSEATKETQRRIQADPELKKHRSEASSAASKAAAARVWSDPTLAAERSKKLSIGKKKWHNAITNDPILAEERARRLSEAAKSGHAKIANDPEAKAARSAKMREAAARVRNDPILWAQRLAKQKATRERNKLAKLAAQKESAE